MRKWWNKLSTQEKVDFKFAALMLSLFFVFILSICITIPNFK